MVIFVAVIMFMFQARKKARRRKRAHFLNDKNLLKIVFHKFLFQYSTDISLPILVTIEAQKYGPMVSDK